MKKIAAVVQILIVLGVVGFGTYHLYLGNFEVSMATLPLLIGYYVFLLSRRSRTGPDAEKRD